MFVFIFASLSSSEIVTCMHDYYEHKAMRSNEPEPIRVTKEITTTTNSSTPGQDITFDNAAEFKLKFDMALIDDDKEACTGKGTTGSGQNAKCEESDVLTASKKQIIKDTFNYVHAYLTERIKLYPSDSDQLTITVYARGSDFDVGSSGLAFASAASRNPTTHRPLSGNIHINPSKLPESAQTLESGNRQFIMTVIHELNHILSFSSSHWGYYKDEQNSNALKYTDADGKVLSDVHSLNELQSRTEMDIGHVFLNTPKLTKFVNERFHVKKNTNLGLEIEDGGSSGTAGSHPNERLFFTDLMQGRTYGPGWLSPIFYYTLWDSGWYVPSEDLIEDLVYLDDQLNPKIEVTEDVLLKPPQHSFPPSYKCTSEALNACFYDYTYTGVCSLESWSALYEKYGHEKWYNPDVQNKVGSDDLLDFANLILPWYSCRDEGSAGLKRRLELDSNYKKETYGESFVANSTCALSTLQKSATGGLIAEPRCYQVWCGTDKKVRLVVDGQETFCKKDGFAAKFDGYAGSITCPPAAVVCANRELREIFGVTDLFPDRGPIDGGNLVAVTGNDFLKYNPDNVSIELGTVPCRIKIYRDNYILCKLDTPDQSLQDAIKKGSNKVLSLSQGENIYRKLVANVTTSSGTQLSTPLPDMYVFTNRKYSTGLKT